MVKVTICFRGDLEELLPSGKKDKIHEVVFRGKRSVKDLIESFGIPHTEVESILVNGGVVDFFYILQERDRVEIYPHVLRSDSAVNSHGKPGEEIFLCDEHLWKLARRLRLLGFDTSFDREWDDSQLAAISEKEGRILLTRDRGLLMRKKVTRGLLIRSFDTEEQVKEVLDRLNLKDRCQPFSRCLLCSGLLKKVAAEDDDFEKIKHKIPDKVRSWCQAYNICSSCGHIYWKGSHYKKLAAKVRTYLGV